MASQDLKQRFKDQDQQPDVADAAGKIKRKSASRRGFISLALAVAFPLALTVLDIYLFGSATGVKKPFYIPPLWALHLASITSAFLSGLAAWLVWADGGFHRQPTALSFYMAQLGISLGWYPIVFGAGATRVGLALCAALFGSLVAGWRAFKSLNPAAGDVFVPCLVWAVMVTAVNLRLVYSK